MIRSAEFGADTLYFAGDPTSELLFGNHYVQHPSISFGNADLSERHSPWWRFRSNLTKWLKRDRLIRMKRFRKRDAHHDPTVSSRPLHIISEGYRYTDSGQREIVKQWKKSKRNIRWNSKTLHIALVKRLQSLNAPQDFSQSSIYIP